MCGIIGYTGPRQAAQVLIEGLGRLEYRGYDSAGISVCGDDGGVETLKAQGRLANLEEKLKGHPLPGHCGIGHTRWATHGAPSDLNAHPHAAGRVTLVHNGIIENYLELKKALQGKGYQFASQTDTEVAAAVIDSHYDGEPLAAIAAALGEIRGSYAFGILFAGHPHEIYAVRKDGPLIVALGEGENFIASDMTAVVGHTRRYFTLDEGEVACISGQGARVTDLAGRPVQKEVLSADWSVEQAQKGGFAHFMRKEIHEQPEAILATLRPRIREGLPSFAYDQIPASLFKNISRVQIVACGTAMHAGLVGKRLIEDLARLPVEVDIASEFRYRNPIVEKDHLVIVISQSGETADSLAALRLAQSLGAPTLGIVNVAGSSIAREADYLIHTLAGPEISVASTKAYSVQIAVLYLLAFALGRQRGLLSDEETRRLVAALLQAVEGVRAAIGLEGPLEQAAARFVKADSLFFIGRGLDFALASEGSLKLKEISYIHSEAYAAGELKHGTISLITEGVGVVALATQQATLAKTVSNIKEVKARGAFVLLFARQGAQFEPGLADLLIELPDLEDRFMPLCTVVALQLLAYHSAVLRGCDVDKPRNLAKSVTVE